MFIDRTLAGVHDRVSSRIFYGKNYNYTPGRPWSVSLEYSHDGVKAEVTEHAMTLEEAFQTAWFKIEKVLTGGLGPSALRPAIEHKSEPKPEGRAAAGFDGADDDIPF